MARQKRRRWRSTLTAFVVLVPIIVVVVYSSFQVSDYECEVCIAFAGQEICRTVTATSQEEGLRSATDNACALLAGGMTDTIRCSHTPPSRAGCKPMHR